jgi:hypothetical protein
MNLRHNLKRLFNRQYDQDAKAAERGFADAKAEVDAKWAKRAEDLASVMAECKTALLKSQHTKQEIADGIAGMEAVHAAMTLSPRPVASAPVTQGAKAVERMILDAITETTADADTELAEMDLKTVTAWSEIIKKQLAEWPTQSMDTNMKRFAAWPKYVQEIFRRKLDAAVTKKNKS